MGFADASSRPLPPQLPDYLRGTPAQNPGHQQCERPARTQVAQYTEKPGCNIWRHDRLRIEAVSQLSPKDSEHAEFSSENSDFGAAKSARGGFPNITSFSLCGALFDPQPVEAIEAVFESAYAAEPRIVNRFRQNERSAAAGLVNRLPPSYIPAMNLTDAATVAKQHISELFAADCPRDIRLETFLYDDHLMVWSLTIGFAAAGRDGRISKLVRVSEANKTVLSIRDP